MKTGPISLVLSLVIAVVFIQPGVGSAETTDALDNSQYTPHRSELIRDFAITGTLGLTQLLIPLNWESQRLFPDDVNNLDESIRDARHAKSDNFLNGSGGSLSTPLAVAAIITGLNWSEDRPWRQTGTELLIFANGGIANGFLTQSVKRGFSRRRPILEFASPTDRAELDAKATNHKSFYSGHTSTAFYSASFLRRRISQSLARHGHTGIRSGYQWLTGIALYGWASYVGYSRIEIDKHYFSDVVAGALMGVLFEEVYYRFNSKHWNTHAAWTLTPQVTSESIGVYFAKRF
ncbi:MAG: phosphatase PAP2 family protein [Candidatus Poribacteria bacterium]|nr:phosphatase PAP2 family protein [Candidatus Poribacteria bacterium]